MGFINSNTITFMDTTDTKKIDVHIISNHPTVQIYDTNKGEYIPNWGNDSLKLKPIVYADSLIVTDNIKEFKWTEIKGDTILDLGAIKELEISSNELKNVEFVRFKFSGKYNEKPFENEIVFTSVSTGKDGTNGNSAPAVKAQYSEDGVTKWSDTFDASKHKYIHFSYDGGISWSRPPIKIAGEDGTSVTIQGVAYTNDTLVAGNIVDLYSNETVHNDSTKILGTETGDSYLVGGYLCVYNAANKQFVCTGRIQGPKGDQGDSYYLFIRYADDINGTNMSATAGNRKYIGFYRSSTNVAPTNIGYDTWGWTKFVGDDAKSITLSANTQIFKVDKNNTVSPETLEITAQAVNTSITEWLYSTNGGQSFSTTLPAGVTLSGNKIIITGATMEPNSITVKAWDGVYGDTFTIYKVFDGATGDKGTDAPIAFLTNENITFTANTDGQITGTTVYTHIVSYIGTDKVVPTIEEIGKTDELPDGMTIGEITTESNELVIPIDIANNATLGSTTNDSGTINIRVLTPVNTELKLTWSKVNSGESPILFQLHAPKGYLITYDAPEVTLEPFAYEGSRLIENATFTWYSLNGETWNAINANAYPSLTLNKTDVLKSNVYKCEMTYKDNVYEATATVEDKTDIYESLIRVISSRSSTNKMYWILYATVYSEDGEHDSLLGPISESPSPNPIKGDYWYKVDATNYTVTLLKYSGTVWETTTDTQELLYDWTLIKDTTDIVTLGDQNKVKIVTTNDFSRVCNAQCNIFNSDYALLARNSQVLNDPSDPIVSATEPQNPIDKQLWIKIADNGTYIISIWDDATKKWVVSDADLQNKVHTEKPVRYNAGDIWIVGGDYQPTIYSDGVAENTKYSIGTMLKAQSVSEVYSDGDWVEALNYKENIDDLKSQLNTYNQYFSFDENGIIMTAKSSSGEISEFKTKLTNTELGFYQGENKVAHINDNQLNISKAEITNGLKVTGTQDAPPTLSIGGFALVIESNGSLSIGYNA